MSRVTNRTSATDPEPKVSTYTCTPRGERLHEVKGNGNTVDYTYYLDGLLRSQVERKTDQTLVAEHSIEYNLNGHRTRDVSRKMNADNNSDTLSTTTEYRYDPQDRVASVIKTGTGAGTEAYVHDANGNVVSQSVGGVATTLNYDRDRLLTSTAGGVTSSYNYDPFGRLDTITVAGTVVERNVYDGFNPHSDVEQLTDEEGDSKATYGYTAYGQDDVAPHRARTGKVRPQAA